MSAFNWVKFYAICPKCCELAHIESQCHVASSFEGDEMGRFCNNVYRIGEKMRWWKINNVHWKPWAEIDGSIREEDSFIKECCYSTCCNCNADLYSIIAFEDITPVKVVDVGMEENWPADYLR
jgi:myo-inositol catabolism protein IolC